MIKLVILDMAGTIIDEGNLVYKVMQSTLEEYGYLVSFEKILEYGAGFEKHAALHEIIRSCSNQKVEINHVSEIYRKYFENLEKAYQLFPVRLFPEVAKMFLKLKNLQVYIAINTGFPRELAERLLLQVGFKEGNDFNLLVTSSDVIYTRPTPEMIKNICQTLGVSTNHTIKIGDSISDIEEGKNANLRYSIGVATGAFTSSELRIASPDFILKDLSEIIPIVEEIKINV